MSPYAGYKDSQIAVVPGSTWELTTPPALNETQRPGLTNAIESNGDQIDGSPNIHRLYAMALVSALKAQGISDIAIRELTNSASPLSGLNGQPRISLSAPTTAKPPTVENVARAINQVNVQAGIEARNHARVSTVNAGDAFFSRSMATASTVGVAAGASASAVETGESTDVAERSGEAQGAAMRIGRQMFAAAVIPAASVVGLAEGLEKASEDGALDEVASRSDSRSPELGIGLNLAPLKGADN